jgi:hypothetical protein
MSDDRAHLMTEVRLQTDKGLHKALDALCRTLTVVSTYKQYGKKDLIVDHELKRINDVIRLIQTKLKSEEV